MAEWSSSRNAGAADPSRGRLLERVEAFIRQHGMLVDSERVLVGVSGGVDSVVLLHLLKRLGYAPVGAHVNFQLRGHDADADESHVRALCESMNVPLHVARYDTVTYAGQRDLSIQDAARTLRYEFFEHLAGNEQIRAVAVAQHADDQAETLLLNLFRGTGLEGLAGMPPVRSISSGSDVRLIRPLLCARRREIEAHARSYALTWRVDKSNKDVKYRRSAVREALMPIVERYFGDAAPDHLARTAEIVRQYLDEQFEPEVDERFAAVAFERPDGVGMLGLDALVAQPPVWRRRLILEALQRWLPEAARTFTTTTAIGSLLDSQTGRTVEVAGGTIWRERDGLLFQPEPPAPDALSTTVPATLLPGRPVVLDDGVLRVELLDEPPPDFERTGPFVAHLDAAQLALPLRVRAWQAGDRLQPLGMNGTKKVSDLLTDERLASHRRSQTLVVLSDDEVVWVVGLRIAHYARITPFTHSVVRITFVPHRAP